MNRALGHEPRIFVGVQILAGAPFFINMLGVCLYEAQNIFE